MDPSAGSRGAGRREDEAGPGRSYITWALGRGLNIILRAKRSH
jgi:hypothetical protein